ncbi:lytic murein transglycosylase [Mesorhizobium sp. M6A.T.Ce.TU.016.01.1.1]|nr:lytic murein transglycosylase [Mesorhizobium sp. M6A.T.Ce.TU.016.01.1.1]
MATGLRSYTPLCPAGHLPLKGGDWLSRFPSLITNVERSMAAPSLLISPLEGQMAGRPEGGGLAPPVPIHRSPPTH